MLSIPGLDLKKNKKSCGLFFRMQNGGEIQNSRQSIECSRYVNTAPQNFNLWNLVNYTI
jgi:hypothetical protein